MSDFFGWEHAWKVVGGAVTGLVGAAITYAIWLGRRVIHLDKHKVDSEALKDTLKTVEANFEKCTAELSTSIKSLVDQRRSDTAEIFGALRNAVDRQAETNVQLTGMIAELRGEMRTRRSGSRR